MTPVSHAPSPNEPELTLEESLSVAIAEQNALLAEAVALLRSLTAAAQALLAPPAEPDDLTPPDGLVPCPMADCFAGRNCTLCGGTRRVPRKAAEQLWLSPM